jgi:hypothetical protein
MLLLLLSLLLLVVVVVVVVYSDWISVSCHLYKLAVSFTFRPLYTKKVVPPESAVEATGWADQRCLTRLQKD